MNLWEKFDKAIDVEGLKKDVAEASTGSMEFKEVPVGQYEVKVNKMELTESKKGSPMLTIWFKILAGEYEGSLIFYNQVLSTGFGIHNANEMLKSLGTDTEVKFDNFKQYNDTILDVHEAVEGKLEFALDYSKNNKGYNVYKITDVYEV
ncbi:DUF669 domain-containing protein [Clostridium peptidivorans]|uniref:DUF669 domain-containing protein n=1 Tax=Clostridium peptidivorans TaxID=100174 RepID=UPI000BE28745|nr:DUF669 domain-containing protein [Clostridium peptidivorans]